ncbi:site-specific DNA-methyltransferase (adenine-specific) [Methanofollis sp. W23]|uniref:DNA-methyltransferase n=1 Tax=Methanofollis sp. W23 TaxID=2817849 RepID=UPI001AE3C0F3|nr:site-specific DNA-methyltransferase [Methanofollis sp. W23]MBP2146010.1 site-specific DNA-methyltransferase (adenine-specific) [Methanofollis sp. W23]
MKSITRDGNTFYNGDCITGAREVIEDGSVDLIITDPPYGIGGDTLHRHYNRDEGYVVDGYVEIPESEYGEFSLNWIQEAERVLRPGGSIYIVSGYTNLYHILHALRQTSLREVNHIIWKYNFGVYTSRKYVSSHYHILFYEKPGGERTFNLESRYGTGEHAPDGGSLNYRDREDVWVINREYKPGQVKNKNELPTALLTRMIQYSSNADDVICDFFMGGFSTARVATGLGRKFVGFEVSETIFENGVHDLQAVTPGFLLSSLRTPVLGTPKNQRKRWTADERRRLDRQYEELRNKGTTRKRSIEILQEEFGRGRWAIERALKERKNRSSHL